MGLLIIDAAMFPYIQKQLFFVIYDYFVVLTYTCISTLIPSHYYQYLKSSGHKLNVKEMYWVLDPKLTV